MWHIELKPVIHFEPLTLNRYLRWFDLIAAYKDIGLPNSTYYNYAMVF